MAKKKVTFKLSAEQQAKVVRLAGNFTGWEQGAIVMKHARSGEWKADVSLEPGEYEYKFIADGNWLTDPQADAQKANASGITNSVKFVR
jgi:hypothetical protein